MATTGAGQACCGEDGSWSPKPGGPVAAACILCRRSPTYWQKALAGPYVAQPLQFDVDAAALATRLAEIAADETWPESLRAEARSAGPGLEVSALTDDAIAAALTAHLRAGRRQP
jgi:hypothetical protein